MSIYFDSNCDSFLQSPITDGTPRFPVTGAGWFKKESITEREQRFFVVGQKHSNCHATYSWNLNAQVAFKDNSGAEQDADIFSPLSAFPADTWVFVAFRAYSNSDYSLLTAQKGDTPEIRYFSGTSGAWVFGEFLQGVAVGSIDVALNGAKAVSRNIYAANVTLWNRTLTDQELTEISNGARPESYTSGLMGSWISGTGDTYASELDNVHPGAMGPLVEYNGFDVVPGGGAYPPKISTDNPIVDEPPVPPPKAFIRAALKDVKNGAPLANRNVKYKLEAGASFGAQTLEYHGEVVTDATGAIVISLDNHDVGDVFYSTFVETTGDITVADASVGGGRVVGE